MTIDKILSYSSSFGTFISAIAALYAIWLTIFQRRLSYKPVLIIGDISIESTSNDKNVFDIYCIKEKLSTKAKLNNIGLGSATSLKYSWEYDYEDGVREYQKFYHSKNNKYDDSILITEDEGFIEFERKDEVEYYSTMNRAFNIDYILPYNSKKEHTEILTPTAALIIMSNINIAQFSSLKTIPAKIKGPRLIIEYQDLEGKRIRNEWESQLDLNYMTFSRDIIKSEWSLRFIPSSRKWTQNGLRRIRKRYTKSRIKIKTNKNK